MGEGGEGWLWMKLIPARELAAAKLNKVYIKNCEQCKLIKFGCKPMSLSN